MGNKLGQDAAFGSIVAAGISKRFYAVCAAMQGLLANPKIIEALSIKYPNSSEWHEINKHIITLAYLHADELLKQENE